MLRAAAVSKKVPLPPWSSRTTSEKIAHVLGVWFGCGHMPGMPGHTGTAGAIPLYLLVRPHGLIALAATAVLITAIGTWASNVECRVLKTKDPQIVVIDEVAGVLITWLAAPVGWKGLLAGFVLFRIYDQFKPFPSRWAERNLPNGWGVMFDDVFAGMWGAATLLVALRIPALAHFLV
jgi:phosphatidylglycerophosphatase A